MTLLTPIDYLASRARRNAAEIAVVSQGRVITFRELEMKVRRVAGRLRKRGIEPGQTVAIYHRDPIAIWILALALFHEGAAGCTAHPNFEAMPKGLNVDVYLARRPMPFMGQTPVVLIDPDWIRDSAKLTEAITPRSFANPDATGLIVSSSGTTGEPKAVPISLRMLDQRLKSGAVAMPPSGPILCMMSLATLGGFTYAYRALGAGVAKFSPIRPPP